MNMKAKVQELIDALEDADLHPRSYSGRGMEGAHCVAVSGDVDPYEVGAAVGPGFDTPRQDSLGKGIVIYWPRYEWPKGT